MSVLVCLMVSTIVLMAVLVMRVHAGEESLTKAHDPHINGRHANTDWRKMVLPVADGPFLRPADAANARPVWGHKDGLQVGLYPMQGPRGLIRIYAPYLKIEEYRIINFIAIEPIVVGAKPRGLSEVEDSGIDDAPGLRFWAANSPNDTTPRIAEDHPARGVLSRDGNVDVLQFYVMSEPFKNGAHAYVRVTLRTDRPEEVGVAAFSCKDSKPMTFCILSATVGNYARLRELHFADKVVTSHQLWPDYKKDWFAEHKSFGLKEMFRTPDGEALVASTPDEADPASVKEGFPKPGWRYIGKKATQYWRCPKPDPNLRVQVNGRFTYWDTQAPIPGGISFENLEMVEPFIEGKEFWFGVTLKSPQELMPRK